MNEKQIRDDLKVIDETTDDQLDTYIKQGLLLLAAIAINLSIITHRLGDK